MEGQPPNENPIVGELHRRYETLPGQSTKLGTRTDVGVWYKSPLVWLSIITFLYLSILSLLAFITVVPGWVFLQVRPMLFAWGIGGVVLIFVDAILFIIYISNAIHASFRHMAELSAFAVALVLAYVIGLVILWRFDGEFGNPDITDIFDRLRRSGRDAPMGLDALIFAEYLTTFTVLAAQFLVLIFGFYRAMHAHVYPMATHAYLTEREMRPIEAALAASATKTPPNV